VSDKWISVVEGLPEDKQMCIVFNSQVEYPFIARYIGGRDFHDFFKNWVPVDYWMLMPDPPKEPSDD